MTAIRNGEMEWELEGEYEFEGGRRIRGRI